MVLLTRIQERRGPDTAVSLRPDPTTTRMIVTTGLAELSVPDSCSSTTHGLELLAVHCTIDAASTSPLTSRISTAELRLGIAALFATTTTNVSLAALAAS